jgi:2-hydroxychromene-2-carboxylate isomerase
MSACDHFERGRMKIEFFFDCSSPWTYLAFENIQPLAADSDGG